MARLPRVVLPGQPLHVIQRGNNRSTIFFAEGDYRFYLECVQDACVRWECGVHAYVLMTNYVHLLLTPQYEDGVSRMMQSVGRRYVQYVNDQYRRTGTLWEGRFKSALIDTERYLLRCYRYIELNPVRAGMVVHPSDYEWSSYRHHGEGCEDRLIQDHPLYLSLGKSREDRAQAYREFFGQALEDETLEKIREATNTGWVLGNDRFRLEIEETLKRRAAPLRRGGDRKSKAFRERSLEPT